MKEIKLTQGKVALVDDEDFDYLNQFKWHASKSRKTFYASRGKNPAIKMHRFIMKTKEGLQVDHIDHNGLNNQKNNLRNCTIHQNNMNKGMGEKEYMRGIYKAKNRFRSIITLNYKSYSIGFFKTEEEAARAYDQKAKEMFGEFANLNFK